MTYVELRKRHQEEVNNFPLGAAFSDKQFKEMMAKWGLTEKDTDKIYHVGGGMFVRRTDSRALHEMLDRHQKELEEAIHGDDGTFAYQMFVYEFNNHEYSYTHDPENTLNACGLTVDEILADEILLAAYRKAERECS